MIKMESTSTSRHGITIIKNRALLLFLCFLNILCIRSQSGWTQHFFQGRPYWFNSLTRQSTWQDPSVSQSIPQSIAMNSRLETAESPTSVGRSTFRPSRVKSSGSVKSTATPSSTSSIPKTLISGSPSASSQEQHGSTANNEFDVLSALKVADRRIVDLEASLVEKDAALKSEQLRLQRAEENNTSIIDELAESLQEVEDDYSELKNQLAAEKQIATALRNKVIALTASKEDLRDKTDRLEKEQQRLDRLPRQLLSKFLGGMRDGAPRKTEKGVGPVKPSGSNKQNFSRTIALLRQNVSILSDKVVSKDETIRDLGRQVLEYQQRDEDRDGALAQLQYRIRGMFADRARLLDLIDALSANLCDMAVKASILQRFIEGICADFAARQVRWGAAETSETDRKNEALGKNEGVSPTSLSNATATIGAEEIAPSVTESKEDPLHRPSPVTSDVIDLDAIPDSNSIADADDSSTLVDIVLDDPDPEAILSSDLKAFKWSRQ